MLSSLLAENLPEINAAGNINCLTMKSNFKVSKPLDTLVQLSPSYRNLVTLSSLLSRGRILIGQTDFRESNLGLNLNFITHCLWTKISTSVYLPFKEQI